MEAINTNDGEEIPIAELRDQGGLKKDIIKLVRKMPSPDRECETTDFLYALQYVLNSHINYEEEFKSSALNKIEDYGEALNVAISVIEETGMVINGVDSEPVVKMIRHIAEHGIDSLTAGDRQYIESLNNSN